MLKKNGCQDRSLCYAILEALYPAPLFATGGQGEAAISNQLHDQGTMCQSGSNYRCGRHAIPRRRLL